MSSVDTKLDCFDTYFDEDIYLDDLVNMTEAEREAYFEQLIEQYDMSEEDREAFQAALDAELSDLYEIIHEQSQQLEAIIDSDLSTAADIAAAEAAMADLDAIMPYLTGDISSDWGDAEDSWEERSVEITSGEDYTHSPEDPQNGETYTVTLTEDTSGSAFNSEENEDWLDLDEDGYRETDPDANKDGIADDDYDGDHVITEADLTYSTEDRSQVSIDLDDGDSIEMSSYDAETQTVIFKITKEDGTEYYLKIVGDVDIVCSVLPTNLDSMPEDVTARMFEYENSEHSHFYFVEGHDPQEYDSYYTIIKSSDFENVPPPITPSSEDFENGRSYTVTLEDGVADTLELNFGDDVELAFSEGPNGELIITATNAEGQTITITVENWSVELDDEGNQDRININGGIIDDTDLDNLAQIGNEPEGAYHSNVIPSHIIYHDGDEDSIYDEAHQDDESPPVPPSKPA